MLHRVGGGHVPGTSLQRSSWSLLLHQRRKKGPCLPALVGILPSTRLLRANLCAPSPLPCEKERILLLAQIALQNSETPIFDKLLRKQEETRRSLIILSKGGKIKATSSKVSDTTALLSPPPNLAKWGGVLNFGLVFGPHLEVPWGCSGQYVVSGMAL